MISKLVLATRNQGKVNEITALLNISNLEILNLNNFPNIPPIIENGVSFTENALIKANTVFTAIGLPVLADDSGLEVDYLNGAPGIYSSRFAGENASDEENNQKLLRLLKAVPDEQRGARFRCVMVLKTVEQTQITEGVCEGIILKAPRGDQGFGYDPLFYVPGLKKSFAEIEVELKNKISHRGIAVSRVRELLQKWQKNT